MSRRLVTRLRGKPLAYRIDADGAMVAERCRCPTQPDSCVDRCPTCGGVGLHAQRITRGAIRCEGGCGLVVPMGRPRW